MTPRRALWLVLAVAVVLGAWGLRWGLPSEYGWAPDEVLPADVDAAVAQRFAHGWHSKYPPLHFALLAVASAPVRVVGRGMDWDAAAVHDARMTAGRLLSLALSVGVLIAVYRCGREVGDPLAGALAAALLAGSVPFVYYAKMANLDVPYLFWFALSLLFFLRALRRGRTSDFDFEFGCHATARSDQSLLPLKIKVSPVQICPSAPQPSRERISYSNQALSASLHSPAKVMNTCGICLYLLSPWPPNLTTSYSTHADQRANREAALGPLRGLSYHLGEHITRIQVRLVP